MNIENLAPGYRAQSADKQYATGSTDADESTDFSLQPAENGALPTGTDHAITDRAIADRAITEWADKELNLPGTAGQAPPFPEHVALAAMFPAGPVLTGSPAGVSVQTFLPTEQQILVNTRNSVRPGSATSEISAVPTPGHRTAGGISPDSKLLQFSQRGDQAITTAHTTSQTVPTPPVAGDAAVGSTAPKTTAVAAAAVALAGGGTQNHPAAPGLPRPEVDQAATTPPANSETSDSDTARRPQAVPTTNTVASPPIAAGPFAGSGDVSLSAAASGMAVETSQQSDLQIVEVSHKISDAQTSQQAGAAPAPGRSAAAMQIIARAAGALQDRPVELMLHPAELGRVRLTLQASDGAMAVLISVERPETLDLLRRNIDQLASQLRDIGYQKLTFDFAGQGHQFAGGESGGETDGEIGGAGNPAYEEGSDPLSRHDQPSEALRLMVGADAGLDIRL